MDELVSIQDTNELIQDRLRKLSELKQRGIDPFAVERFDRTHVAADVLSNFEELENKDVKAAGRIVSIREMGKASFAHIEDDSGKIQLYLKKDEVGEEKYSLIKLMDIGDFIGVEGFVFRTRTGEISIHVKDFTLLAKSLRPAPFGKEKGDEHWYGLQDVELKYRERHLDLMTNRQSKETFVKRSKIVSTVRRFFDNRGYLEVETPVLQSVAGGAAARPFTTYHNALDHDFYLRISLELYLKRLIIGGLEKVYEIGRVFRNEGISTRHNPEFTMLESYEAYANLEDMMSLVEDLMGTACRELHGGLKFPWHGHEIDLTPPFARLPILEGIEKYAGVKPEEFETLDKARAAMERVGLPTEHEHVVGGIIEKLHESFVEPNLIQPTFVTDFPLETSPLAKKRQDDPRFTRRFDFYIATQEVAPAYSELNDPIDQRERFTAQAAVRATGDEEAHPFDEDFLRALEYGMPPTGGLGVGIDRLCMILCDVDSIRDIVLFPQMRPEK